MKNIRNFFSYISPCSPGTGIQVKKFQGFTIHILYLVISILTVLAFGFFQPGTVSANIIRVWRYFDASMFSFFNNCSQVLNEILIVALSVVEMEADEMMSP